MEKTTVRADMDEDIRSLPPMVKFLDAAKLLGIGRTTAYGMAKAAGIEAFPVAVVKQGGRLYVRRADLAAYLTAQPATAGAA